MRKQNPPLATVLKLAVCLLIVKVVATTVLLYRDYVPPNFGADFLLGRERYFWAGYHIPFFVHLFAGPASLLLGMALLSDRVRRRFPWWHRALGRAQVLCVLVLVAPSGLLMAGYAQYGAVAGVGFALLAVATAATVALGWRAALRGRFDEHRQWMLRGFLLLGSAIVIRLNGGIGEVCGITESWFYAQSAWSSWLVPLILFEASQRASQSSAVTRTPR